jgi:hypothetical protein
MVIGVISSLLGGKNGALKTISKVVDDLHTSEEEKLDKKILMQRIQQKLAEKQLDVNKAEASHSSIFVSGWRPAIGWTGAFALMFEFILSPAIEWYAKFSGMELTAPGIPTPMYKKGGKVGKKKQGYKARKDESIAMRVKKKRTKKQLKASRDESYGKWGGGKGKGKINK